MGTPSLDYQRPVVGYHGCDASTVERVLLHGEHLVPSNNRWDWLGKGVYFWEFGPQRAMDFAHEQMRRGKVEKPAVLGAFIHLGRCFDLTDTEHTSQLTEVFPLWRGAFSAQGGALPQNRKGKGSDELLLRNRDCALINWYNEKILDPGTQGGYHYQSVRGVFVEGEPVYEGAGIFTKTHIQIAVRDLACITGYFLPTTFFEESEP